MKKLIYFTLGNNPNYLKLADMCINSLYHNGYDGDFLFITDLKNEILNQINFKTQPYFLELKESSLLESSANKLKVYSFNKINEYDKIIFSDLDILWVSNPEIIFNLIDEDKFYMSNEEGLMTDELWGGLLLTDTEKIEIDQLKIFGLNCGLFAFNNKMIPYLEQVDLFLNNNLELQNVCLEQPFLNVYVYRNNLYNNKLNGLVSHKGYHFVNSPLDLIKYDGVVLHFAGGPGNYDFKYEKMLIYFNEYFK